MSLDLHTKYRPTDFDGMVGHATTIKQLKAALDKKTGRVFLLVGETGSGKTTVARIIAKRVGATSSANLLELDAATKNSVDDMRTLMDTIQYRPMGASPTRVVIIDEAHGLSKPAWTSMLKTVEEPPPDCYFVFCTTEAAKVPENIRNRCLQFVFKPLPAEDILGLLVQVNEKESLTPSEDVLYLVAERCGGSARKALTMLAKLADVKTRKKAAAILDTYDGESDDDATINLCRRLAKGGLTWPEAQKLLNDLKATNPESVRMVVLNYFQTVLLGAKGDGAAQSALAVLDAFSEPYGSSNGIWPVGLSLGRLVF